MASQITSQIIKKIFISGKIKAETGLAIGGTDVGLEIGGLDKIVVRHPITKRPYIPGSSLRRKIRSLLERTRQGENMKEVVHREKGSIHMHQCEKEPFCEICKVFGVPAEVAEGNTRLIVRDGNCINIDWLEKAIDTELPYTETKTEVVIDRITSGAMPRTFERVPAGAEFELEMILTIYEGDNEQEYLDLVFEGLRLLEDDYLGGSGSRGYGKVKIKDVKVTQRTAEDYSSGRERQLYTNGDKFDQLKKNYKDMF